MSSSPLSRGRFLEAILQIAGAGAGWPGLADLVQMIQASICIPVKRRSRSYVDGDKSTGKGRRCARIHVHLLVDAAQTYAQPRPEGEDDISP